MIWFMRGFPWVMAVLQFVMAGLCAYKGERAMTIVWACYGISNIALAEVK